MDLDKVIDWKIQEQGEALIFPLGINAGNNGVKCYVGSKYYSHKKFLIRSVIREADRLIGFAPNSSMASSVFTLVDVKSKDRDVKKLKGKTIIMGEKAYEDNEASTSINSYKSGKLDYIFHQTMAAINNLMSLDYFQQFDKFVFPLVLTVPTEGLQGLAKQAIEGDYTLKVNGSGRTVEVTLRVLDVLLEGQAAGILLTRLERVSRVALLDLGNGNTIVRVVNDQGLITGNKVLDKGVKFLVDKLATSNAITEKVKYSGDTLDIVLALEAGKTEFSAFIKDQRISVDFSSDYQALLTNWLGFRVKTLYQVLETQQGASNIPLFAIGGGSLLPGLEQELKGYGIQVAPESQFLDAIGLTALANVLYQGGE